MSKKHLLFYLKYHADKWGGSTALPTVFGMGCLVNIFSLFVICSGGFFPELLPFIIVLISVGAGFLVTANINKNFPLTILSFAYMSTFISFSMILMSFIIVCTQTSILASESVILFYMMGGYFIVGGVSCKIVHNRIKKGVYTKQRKFENPTLATLVLSGICGSLVIWALRWISDEQIIMIIGITVILIGAYIMSVQMHLYMCFYYLVKFGQFERKRKVWYFVGLKGYGKINRERIAISVGQAPKRIHKLQGARRKF
jgi:hypothetical protein